MIEVTQTQRSASHSALAVGVVAANFLLAPLPVDVQSAQQLRPRVSVVGALPTRNGRTDPFGAMILVPRQESSIIEFYGGLLSSQEDLGGDFAKVLFDNVWDLYAR